MTANQLRQKYLSFFKNRGHAVVPSAPLVPENDPTVLFTTAGMHPLVPYLLGEPHPQGKRLVNFQKCLRTDDIDEVGDTFHHTFFEMLGNWSLGDPASPDGVGVGGYWKKEAISWSWEFLTRELGLDPKIIYVSCFAGDVDAPRDEESARIWQKVGVPKERIYFYGKRENWWGPVGKIGPCGPDTEMFYDITGKRHGANCHPNDNCGRFFEIWNDVFMQYNKTAQGKHEPLKQKNVDTGMGVERTVAVLQGKNDNYETELFVPIVQSIEQQTGTVYSNEKNKRAIRIIADHARAAVFAVADGVAPSNKERGYVLRRLIRRAQRFGRLIGANELFLFKLVGSVVESLGDIYPQIKENQEKIQDEVQLEEERFQKTLEKGLRQIEKLPKLDGKIAFFLYETYGFPLELTEEMAREREQKVDKKAFEREFEKHRRLSQTVARGRFAGGLAEATQETKRLHTATHLLHQALRVVLGTHVKQAGSHITSERLRFDFTHPKPLTVDEIKGAEDLVNQGVREDLPVSYKITTLKKALAEGALAFFGEKYGKKVKVYTIGPSTGSGWFSKEVCGGPHVKTTSEVGRVRIVKETGAGAGIRRIYAAVS